MGVVNGKSHLPTACIVSCFEERLGFWNSVFCFLLWTAFFFVPLLSHTCFAALTIKAPDGEHAAVDTRSMQTALHHHKLPGKGIRKHHFLYKAPAPRLKHEGWALPTALQHCYGLQGKGCSSHCGQLEHPVAARHHNLGRVGLSPSSASKKAESSFLDPGPSIMTQQRGVCCRQQPLLPSSSPKELSPHLLQPGYLFPCSCSAFVPHIRQLPCLQPHTAAGEGNKTGKLLLMMCVPH